MLGHKDGSIVFSSANPQPSKAAQQTLQQREITFVLFKVMLQPIINKFNKDLSGLQRTSAGAQSSAAVSAPTLVQCLFSAVQHLHSIFSHSLLMVKTKVSVFISGKTEDFFF